MARQIRELFRRVQTGRDIVLVDQRGTGKSNPLKCTSDSDSLQDLNESDLAGEERLRKCLENYNADPRMYTTSIAMDDLDDVRAHLGYGKINLYGGSYGTRAALVYLRQHESNVRAVVLDGVAPPDMRLPLFFSRDAERAFGKLLADCEADATCHAKYPDLAGRTRKLLERLDRSPAQTRLTHPRTGIAENVTINAELVANILVGALYSPMTASLIPELIKRAEAEDFQSLLALASVGETARENMSLGMQLSVVCAEDFPRITPEDVSRETQGRIFAAHLLKSRMKACEFWPKGAVSAHYYQPVVSSVPVLVLSGDLDPVTPPEWGETVAKQLGNARHIVVPGTGHGAITTGCGVRLMREFVEKGSTGDLDTSCLQGLKRPPFFLTPAGPDPAATRSTSQ
jgi:pimeloyl-ACP methyl ester carboxylesterase